METSTLYKSTLTIIYKTKHAIISKSSFIGKFRKKSQLHVESELIQYSDERHKVYRNDRR